MLSEFIEKYGEGEKEKPSTLKRAVRWSQREIDALIDSIGQNATVILGPKTGSVTAATKKEAWINIREQVNLASCGTISRSVHQVEHKWWDLKCNARMRVSMVNTKNESKKMTHQRSKYVIHKPTENDYKVMSVITGTYSSEKKTIDKAVKQKIESKEEDNETLLDSHLPSLKENEKKKQSRLTRKRPWASVDTMNYRNGIGDAHNKEVRIIPPITNGSTDDTDLFCNIDISRDSEIAVPAIQDQVYDCEADKQFLLSFLPQLRQCTERQKSKFRTQMCMTIEKILHGDDETTNQL